MAQDSKKHIKKFKVKKRNPGVHSKNAPKQKPNRGQGKRSK